jgi:hypothetical protein
MQSVETARTEHFVRIRPSAITVSMVTMGVQSTFENRALSTYDFDAVFRPTSVG